MVDRCLSLWQMNSHLNDVMADDIAFVADGIVTQNGMLVRQILLSLWQMEWPLGHYFSLGSV